MSKKRAQKEYKPGKVASKKRMLEQIKITAKEDWADGFEFEVTLYTIGQCSECKRKKVEVILVEVEGTSTQLSTSKKRRKRLCKECADKIFGDCGL